MALFSVAFLGSTPIGGPIVGWVSEVLGPRAGLALGGVAAITTALAAWLWSRSPPAREVSEEPAVAQAA
jgi:hypothetical protein